ncbi:hypothetical protein Sjap_002052 [Stephania japonica]|uniref:Uncharacterized protein n=1 Tax=Stephania japonica TaxID=461633 RepID=A0AAP0KL36_9MAGN
MQADEDVGKIALPVPVLIVRKVPDLGGESAMKKRKTVEDEDNNYSDEEAKRSRMVRDPIQDANIEFLVAVEVEGGDEGEAGEQQRENCQLQECDDDPAISPQHNEQNLNISQKLDCMTEVEESKKSNVQSNASDGEIWNFDPNVDLNENGNKFAPSLSKEAPEMQSQEYPGWCIGDMEHMAIDRPSSVY